jgi:hypothetical protein
MNWAIAQSPPYSSCLRLNPTYPSQFPSEFTLPRRGGGGTRLPRQKLKIPKQKSKLLDQRVLIRTTCFPLGGTWKQQLLSWEEFWVCAAS